MSECVWIYIFQSFKKKKFQVNICKYVSQGTLKTRWTTNLISLVPLYLFISPLNPSVCCLDFIFVAAVATYSRLINTPRPRQLKLEVSGKKVRGEKKKKKSELIRITFSNPAPIGSIVYWMCLWLVAPLIAAVTSRERTWVMVISPTARRDLWINPLEASATNTITCAFSHRSVLFRNVSINWTKKKKQLLFKYIFSQIVELRGKL